jgi:Spy/CpxP family protein refolding chaperone
MNGVEGNRKVTGRISWGLGGVGMQKAWIMAGMVFAAAAAWAGPGDKGGAEGHGREDRGSMHQGRGGRPDFDFLHPRMLKDLGLSEEQQRKLKERRLEARKKRIQLQAEKSTLELELQNVLATHPVREAEAAKLAGRIADADRKALLLKVETMSRFLAGLNPEQHRKVIEHQEEMREKRRAWREEMRKGLSGGLGEDGGEGGDGEGKP